MSSIDAEKAFEKFSLLTEKSQQTMKKGNSLKLIKDISEICSGVNIILNGKIQNILPEKSRKH